MASMRTTLLLFLAPALFAAEPTVQEAQKFLANAEEKLLVLSTEAGRADWVQNNFITDDTEALASAADERVIAENVRLVKESARFDKLKLPPELTRKMKLLKLGLTLAAPSDPKESAEVTRLATSLQATYGKGKYCPGGDKKCLDIDDVTRIMANSTDPKELLDVWQG